MGVPTFPLMVSIVLAALPVVAQVAPSFVGLRYEVISDPDLERLVYKNLPAALVAESGSIVGDVNIPQPWVISMYSSGEARYLWFEKILSNVVTERPKGLRNHQTILVLDAVKLPAGFPGFLHGCEFNGEQDPEIFVIGAITDPDLEWVTEFKQVWRANRQTEKLEEVPPTGIRCFNPTWGI
ncbi:hypothetical protein IQ225_12655 [Synechocystis salina LEGE 06155]|nr:hypothetical protein [Synechocystis salina LEGE 06155]